MSVSLTVVATQRILKKKKKSIKIAFWRSVQMIKALFNKLQFRIFEVFSWTKGVRSEGRLPSGRFLTCQGCFSEPSS